MSFLDNLYFFLLITVPVVVMTVMVEVHFRKERKREAILRRLREV